jgi:hypothetical protein
MTSLDLSCSDFATASTAMFVIDKFLVLESLNLDMATRVDPKILCYLLTNWRNTSRYLLSLILSNSGRKIKLKKFSFCFCGKESFKDDDDFSEYWDLGVVPIHASISNVLNSICENMSCVIVPVLCTTCEEDLSFWSGCGCVKCEVFVSPICMDCEMEGRASYHCSACNSAVIHSGCTASGAWNDDEYEVWRCGDCVRLMAGV